GRRAGHHQPPDLPLGGSRLREPAPGAALSPRRPRVQRQGEGRRADRVPRRSGLGSASDLGAPVFTARAEWDRRMILADREIKLAPHRDHLRIPPRPPDRAIASTSIDLTLHEEISFWTPQLERKGPAAVVYPAQPEFDVARLLRDHGTTLILPSE